MRDSTRDGTSPVLRAANDRGAPRPTGPALVHRRARPAQVGRHLAGRARDGLRGRRPVRRIGHRRVQPDAGDRRPGHPRRHQLPAHAAGATAARCRPACSATWSTSTARRSRATPARCCGATCARAHDAGFQFMCVARGRVLLPRVRRHVRRRSPLDHASYFDLTTFDAVERHPPGHDRAARGHRHPRRVLVPRGRAVPARDRPPLHRRPRRWPTTS